MVNSNVDDDGSDGEDVVPDPPDQLIEEHWRDHYQRDRGIFTDTDREFLLGLKDYANDESVSERRGYVRDRTKNALMDLAYLSMIDDRRRRKIFELLDEETDDGAVRLAVETLIEFLYMGLDRDVEWFEETIAHGISTAISKQQGDDTEYYAGASIDAGVDVDIDITRGYDVDEIEERFRAGHGNTLSPAEVGVLVRTGRLDTDELEALDFTEFGGIDPETGEVWEEGRGSDRKPLPPIPPAKDDG